MGTRKLRHDAYTVGWVCVLDCELNAARALLDEEDEPLEPVLNDDSIYLLGRIGKHNVVITFSGIYGTNSTAQAVTNLVRTFPNIRFGLMVGVGGAVPGSPHPDNSTKDIRLGDVVVSEPKGNHGGVLNYDMGKWKDENQLSIESHLNKPPAILTKAVIRLRADQRFRRGRMPQYIEEASALLSSLPDVDDPSFPGWGEDRLFMSDYSHVEGENDCTKCDSAQLIHRLPRHSNGPVVHYGLIGSGNAVMRNAKLRDRLRDAWGVLCFEMEAAGLMNHFPCLVIRGLCDYSDSHKTKRWQSYAALVAGAYAKDLLSTIGPEQAMKNHPVPKNQQRGLLWAAREGHLSILEQLLDAAVDPDYRDKPWGRSPISQAAEYGKTRCVELLLERGTNPNMLDTNGWSTNQRNAGKTPLMWAAMNNKRGACSVLLAYRADPNIKISEGTALHYAVHHGHQAFVRDLLEGGADPNIQDEKERTPLLLAAIKDHGAGIIAILLEHGADANLVDRHRRPPLSYAAEHGDESTVRLLVDQGRANLNLQGERGRTSLFWAAANGHKAVAEFLLQNGADTSPKDQSGDTALDHARRSNHMSVAELLMAYGVRGI